MEYTFQFGKQKKNFKTHTNTHSLSKNNKISITTMVEMLNYNVKYCGARISLSLSLLSRFQ